MMTRHETTGARAHQKLTDRITELQDALDFALCRLAPLEPADGRAVSNEFVAMVAVAAGGDIVNQESRDIIAAALAEERGKVDSLDHVKTCHSCFAPQHADQAICNQCGAAFL